MTEFCSLGYLFCTCQLSKVFKRTSVEVFDTWPTWRISCCRYRRYQKTESRRINYGLHVYSVLVTQQEGIPVRKFVLTLTSTGLRRMPFGLRW